MIPQSARGTSRVGGSLGRDLCWNTGSHWKRLFLTSLTIQMEIKDPRILFKFAQGIMQLSGPTVPGLNKTQLNVPGWEGASLKHRGEFVFMCTITRLSLEHCNYFIIHKGLKILRKEDAMKKSI